MVERQLPKLNVAGSIPVSRSIFNKLAVTPTLRISTSIQAASLQTFRS